MVLIQTLTVDAINTALIALQRGQSIIIGGDKGQTVNNINVTNKTEGADYSEKIKELTSQIETLKETDTALKAEDVRINDRLNALTQLGISDFTFDDSTRELTIELTDGNVYTTIIRPVPFILSLSGNTLILENEYQREEVELPFILSSEKGAPNGVATLDVTGRVPYSQLPESAMEFKGDWNADTNTPHLQDGTGTNGDFYICSQGGTVNFGTSGSPRNITFYVNDRVIYQGDEEQWKRLPASEVRTVNGQSGDVVLNGTNVNYSNANNSPTLKDKIDTVEGYAKTQSNWTQSDTSAIDYIKNKPNLATVATSGSYNDLSNKPTIPAAQIQSNWTQTNSSSKDFIKNKIPIWITTGSADDNMSPIDSVTDGSMRPVTSNAVYDYSPRGSAYCSTSATAAAKVASMQDYVLQNGATFLITFKNSNSATSALTLKINDTAAKTIYINGSVSSASNYTLSAGTYLCYYYSNKYYLENANGWEVTYSRWATSATSATTASACSGNSATATSAGKLTTARKVYVKLGTASTSETKDFSGDTAIPVNGTLAVANGGTGQTSLSNVTVGSATNATKLGNISVRTTSIGGTTTETGTHWAYVTKAKFTTTSGYIVYSNGLKIQWGTVSSGNNVVKSFDFSSLGLLSFSSASSYKAVFTNEWNNTGTYNANIHIISKTASGMEIKGQSDTNSFIAIGY